MSRRPPALLLLLALSLLASAARAENPFVRFTTIARQLRRRAVPGGLDALSGRRADHRRELPRLRGRERYPTTSFIHRSIGNGARQRQSARDPGRRLLHRRRQRFAGVSAVTHSIRSRSKSAVGLSNLRGTIAMARSDSADSADQPVVHQPRRQRQSRLRSRRRLRACSAMVDRIDDGMARRRRDRRARPIYDLAASTVFTELPLMLDTIRGVRSPTCSLPRVRHQRRRASRSPAPRSGGRRLRSRLAVLTKRRA